MEELIKAAKAGDEAAWNTLYQKFYPGLYAIALQYSKNISQAQDIVQEGFITAFLKLSQLKEGAAFPGWIRKIVIRHCYQWLSKNKASCDIEKISIADERWIDEQMEDKIEKLSDQNRLYSVLGDLPETLRSTVLLRFFTQFQSYSDIAKILSVPVGTVRSRLNEAKSKLFSKWQQPLHSISSTIKESREWNTFYYETMSAVHYQDVYKNKFINHLEKNVQLVYPDGHLDRGNWRFEKLIIDDRTAGSWLKPTNVLSSGNLSVIETKHFNSSEHPHHCPPRSILVLQRKKAQVQKMNLYLSWE